MEAGREKTEMISRAAAETAPESRDERLARIRREIGEGTYETPEKLNAALDAFLDSCEGDEKSSSGPTRPR